MLFEKTKPIFRKGKSKKAKVKKSSESGVSREQQLEKTNPICRVWAVNARFG